jgi:uncharacterized protein YbjT (DUF2867 family)
VSAVDVRDIAAVAAIALTETGHEGKTYTITGPSAVTHSEIATAITTFIDVPPEAFAGALRAAGVPPPCPDDVPMQVVHEPEGVHRQEVVPLEGTLESRRSTLGN